MNKIISNGVVGPINLTTEKCGGVVVNENKMLKDVRLDLICAKMKTLMMMKMDF